MISGTVESKRTGIIDAALRTCYPGRKKVNGTQQIRFANEPPSSLTELIMTESVVSGSIGGSDDMLR